MEPGDIDFDARADRSMANRSIPARTRTARWRVFHPAAKMSGYNRCYDIVARLRRVLRSSVQAVNDLIIHFFTLRPMVWLNRARQQIASMRARRKLPRIASLGLMADYATLILFGAVAEEEADEQPSSSTHPNLIDPGSGLVDPVAAHQLRQHPDEILSPDAEGRLTVPV